jgi:hypothetical protein
MRSTGALAALAAGAVKEQSTRKKLENIIADPKKIVLYWDNHFIKTSVGDLAENALADL